MKKKLLLAVLIVLCLAAMGAKVAYDRHQKEVFVDQWVAAGESMAQSYRDNGIDGYRVCSDGNTVLPSTILTTPDPQLAADRRITQIPADRQSDQAVQALMDSMTLIWIRDEAITTRSDYDLFSLDTPRLILTQAGISREFALTLTEDHGLLTLASRVDTGVGLYLEFSVDKEAAQYLLSRVRPLT